MDRARLADESGAELLHDPVDLHQGAPEPLDRRRVVGPRRGVPLERHGVDELARRRVQVKVDTEVFQLAHDRGVEVGDRAWPERHVTPYAVAASDHQPVVDEVEVQLEGPRTVGNRRSAETAGGEIERYVPRVIEPRRRAQPDLADDLGHEVEGRGGLGPGAVGQRRPVGSGGSVRGVKGLRHGVERTSGGIDHEGRSDLPARRPTSASSPPSAPGLQGFAGARPPRPRPALRDARYRPRSVDMRAIVTGSRPRARRFDAGSRLGLRVRDDRRPGTPFALEERPIRRLSGRANRSPSSRSPTCLECSCGPRPVSS